MGGPGEAHPHGVRGQGAFHFSLCLCPAADQQLLHTEGIRNLFWLPGFTLDSCTCVGRDGGKPGAEEVGGSKLPAPGKQKEPGCFVGSWREVPQFPRGRLLENPGSGTAGLGGAHPHTLCSPQPSLHGPLDTVVCLEAAFRTGPRGGRERLQRTGLTDLLFSCNNPEVSEGLVSSFRGPWIPDFCDRPFAHSIPAPLCCFLTSQVSMSGPWHWLCPGKLFLQHPHGQALTFSSLFKCHLLNEAEPGPG